MAWVMNHSYCHVQYCKRCKNEMKLNKLANSSLIHLCRLPFNWKTPIGYLIALSAEYASVHSALFGFTPVTSFFVGSAFLTTCFVRDIENELPQLNVIARSTRSRKKMMERFCYIVRFHSDAKQLSAMRTIFLQFNSIYFLCRLVDELSQIFEFILFDLFLWSVLSIANAFFVFMSQLVEYKLEFFHFSLSSITNFLHIISLLCKVDA